MTEKINKLQEQLAKIKAQLAEERKRVDVRKRVLVGIAILKSVDDGILKEDSLQKILNKYTTNKWDREFMGLPPLPENTQDNEKSAEYSAQNDNHNQQAQPEYQHH